MSKSPEEEPLEDRIERSEIHQWAMSQNIDLDQLLRDNDLPGYLKETFDEMLMEQHRYFIERKEAENDLSDLSAVWESEINARNLGDMFENYELFEIQQKRKLREMANDLVARWAGGPRPRYL